MQTTNKITQQTQTDIRCILETIDQRLHEVTQGRTERVQGCEVVELQELRRVAQGLLGDG